MLAIEYRRGAGDVSPLLVLLALLAVALVPVAAGLGVRSLMLDRRGREMLAQRERERGTLRGFLTTDERGFAAREASRRGWVLGRRAAAVSAAGVALAVVMLARRRGLSRRVARAILVTAGAHVIVGAGTMVYWFSTGVPHAWRD
jgi:hypothetical protein